MGPRRLSLPRWEENEDVPEKPHFNFRPEIAFPAWQGGCRFDRSGFPCHGRPGLDSGLDAVIHENTGLSG
jgi:hypothetical protein